MPNTPSPEKAKEFTDKYKALTTEYGVDFASIPAYIPDGEGCFKLIIHSMLVELPKEETNTIVTE